MAVMQTARRDSVGAKIHSCHAGGIQGAGEQDLHKRSEGAVG